MRPTCPLARSGLGRKTAEATLTRPRDGAATAATSPSVLSFRTTSSGTTGASLAVPRRSAPEAAPRGDRADRGANAAQRNGRRIGRDGASRRGRFAGRRGRISSREDSTEAGHARARPRQTRDAGPRRPTHRRTAPIPVMSSRDLGKCGHVRSRRGPRQRDAHGVSGRCGGHAPAVVSGKGAERQLGGAQDDRAVFIQCRPLF